MKRISLILKNDLKRRLKAPMSVIVLLLIPMAMTGLIGLIFGPSSGGGNQLPKIKMLVTDNDKNIASKILLGAFNSEQLKDMFQITLVDETEGKQLMSNGKASALVIIPEKFTNHLLNAETTELQVIKNPSEQFLPEVVEEFMQTFGVIISGIVQVFGPEIRAVDTLLSGSLKDVSIAQMTPFLEMAKQKIISMESYLSPLLIQLKKETTGKKEKAPGVNVFSMILPGMAIMFLLFIIEIFLRDILTEREDGKLQRIMFSPISSMEFIFGRIISGWLMGILAFFVMILMGIAVFKISWGNYIYLLILVTVTSFWIAGFFAILNAFFKNKNQAGALVSPIILVFSAFGGSILPVNQLPEAVRWVGDFTLNQWFIKGTQQVIAGEFPVVPVGILLITGLLLFSLAAIFLQKRLTV
ncbi:MAG: ABC transporter permease [bacterium]|nr:ABC transporter permease [bacterium]